MDQATAAPSRPTAAAPPPVPAPPAAKPAEKPKEALPEYKYQPRLPAPKFSIDHLLIQNFVELSLILGPTVNATYRSLSVDDWQDVEGIVNVQDKDRTFKYVTNEMSIIQMYHGLVSVNDKPLAPALDRHKEGYKASEDARLKAIRALPSGLFDLLMLGMVEFENRAKALVGGESLKNF